MSPCFFYLLNVVSYSDYYPYGMLLPGRHGEETNNNYRYGFQGQEDDPEIKGEGNSTNYKYRMHDPRIGRFFAVDPLASKYPHYTPYQFSGNEVISMVELEGLEPAQAASSVPNGEVQQAKNQASTDPNNMTIMNWRSVHTDFTHKDGTVTTSSEWEMLDEYTQATSDESAQIANHVYNLDKDGYDVGGNIKKSTVAGYTLISEISTPSTGFKSGVYKRTIDGVNFYVHAFAGTDDFADGVTDAFAGMNIDAGQITQSLLYGSGVDAMYDADPHARSLIYTGHSLGGGLAAANAMKYNHQAVTFNAMGVSNSFKQDYGLWYKPKITAYIIKGEILNTLQLVKANGTRIIFQPKGTTIQTFTQYTKANGISLNQYNYVYYKTIAYPAYVADKSADNHSMSHFLKYNFK